MRKAQLQVLEYLFFFALAVLVFFVIGANLVGGAGHSGVQSGELSGLDALFFDNIGWVFIFVFLISAYAIARYISS